MTELLTSAQMRTIERGAIEGGAVTGLELMERAGAGVVEAVMEEWPELGPGVHRVLVLCGPGNNGGDGFVVARMLKERGWAVEVFLYGDTESLPPDAKVNCERWAEIGDIGKWDDDAIENALDDFVEAQPDTFRNDLVVDALFGTGLTRPMPDDTARTRHGFVSNVTQIAPQDRPKYVAIDAPSGLCTDSGANLGAMPSDLTVSFHRAKLGHYLLREGHFGGGPGLCGKIRVKDIGLPDELSGGTVHLVAADNLQSAKSSNSHKYTHGHAVILAGGAGKTGAARLAARGALRIGAGLVTLCVPGAAQMEVASHVTALMLTRVEDGKGLAEVLTDRRLNAVCLGPGLGVERARQLVQAAVGAAHTPGVVLDADALTAFESAPEDLIGMLHKRCVLTPHAGEFARLFPDIAAKLIETPTRGPAYSKVDATREAAARAGCVVLFKGPDTVIADPSGRCTVNAAVYDREAHGLATAGSGDVLAGFICGLLARGLEPMRAAESAAWLHVECARSFGPGLIAEDLPEELPKVFRKLPG